MTRLLLALLFCVLALPVRAAEPAPHILVDQFGYLPSLQKRAVIRDPQIGFDSARSFTPGSRYAVVNLDSRRTVFQGEPTAWNDGAVEEDSGDRVWWFDFSMVRTPGRYVVRDLDRRVDSDPFVISPTVYNEVLQDAFRVFYYQRAGFERREPFAQVGYTDRASHLGPGQDREARRYDAPNDRGTARDLRGGWFDAGDYNQYTSWTANYVTSLLASYAENPSIWTDAMGIPESGNGVPDILDEVKWGLDWLSRMQNPDGSVLSVLGRDEASPPSRARGPSFYGPENTSATVTTAGAFALAAETFRDIPSLASLSDEYAERALSAWDWAEANPGVKFYNNSEAHGSGGLAAGQQEVEQDRLDRKRLIAAIHLFALTGEDSFCRVVDRLYGRVGGITAGTANDFEGDMGFTLLTFARQTGVPRRLSDRIRQDYRTAANDWNGWRAIREQASAYGAFMDGYWWGSNAVAARRGSVYTQALVGGVHDGASSDALNAAAGYLHYLHGVNPMGLVYLTNMEAAGAERSASTLYHAWFTDGSRQWDSTRTSRFGPAPGFVVGGPNDGYERAECCATSCGPDGDRVCRRPSLSPPEGQPPAKSYAEFNDGWPINSWSVTENSLGYQADYLRLLSKFVR